MRGLKGSGVVRVLCQRAMTGFTSNPGMYPLALHLEDIGMAAFASLVTCEDHRPVGDVGDGRTPVMAILPEATRNKKAARHEEQHNSNQKDGCHPEEVSCILEICHSCNRKWRCPVAI